MIKGLLPNKRLENSGKTSGLVLTSLIASGILCVFCISCSENTPVGGTVKEDKAPGSLGYSDQASALSRSRLSMLDEAEIRTFASSMISESLLSEKVPEEAAASSFPSPGELLGMLARDRDVDDFIENSAEDGAAGEYYRKVVEMVSELKPLRSSYEALFTGVYSGLVKMGRMKVARQAKEEAKGYKSGVTLPRLSSRPREREYNLSHTFALDIFFMQVENLPLSTLEKGPLVFSLESGIVVGSDSSWNGGEDMASYRSGGVTPKAGNGVIIYSPSTRKYYLYFHLYDVLVSTGDVLPRGFPLGHGGNSGTNARKPGHGEHLHLEIYDATVNRFLRNREIADIVF